LVFSIISLENLISVSCILLSSLLVHIHFSTLYHIIFLKYTLYIAVLILLFVFIL
jgi:hypothetical protein